MHWERLQGRICRMVYLLSLLWNKDFFPFSVSFIQNKVCRFCSVSSDLIQGLNLSFVLFCLLLLLFFFSPLSETPAWKLSRFEEWNLRKGREASRGKKENHGRTAPNKNCSPIVQILLLRIKHFSTSSQCPAPSQYPQNPRGKLQDENEAILCLKATHTQNTGQRLSGRWFSAGLLKPCLKRAIHLRVSSICVIRTRYNVQTREVKSMVPTIKSDIDFTITGTNCSNR